MTAVDAMGRAFGLYRRTAMSRSAIVLVVANVIPLVGVVFFGWSLLTILVLYWVENGIVGLLNVPKILFSQGSLMPAIPDMPDAAARAATASPEQAASLQAAWRQMRDNRAQLVAGPGGATTRAGPLPTPLSSPLAVAGRLGLALFFAVHYGIFWLGHGFFVLFALPQFGLMRSSSPGPCFDGLSGGSLSPPAPGFPPFPGSGVECAASPFGEVLWGSVGLAALALFLSHGASFLFNFVGRGEYRTTSPARQMGAVYGRVVVLHLTIIFGAMVVAFLGSPLGALLVLIVLKTAFDLTLHLREHRNAARGAQGALTPSV
jgi:Family of unknown function (DUF6498)